MKRHSPEEFNITGRFSGIRKLLFRIKSEKINTPHVVNSFLLMITDRIYHKLKKQADRFEKELFIKRWLKNVDGRTFFDFNGALFPDIRDDAVNWDLFYDWIFEDTFLINCYHDDDYSKSIVDVLDKLMSEGPYGYVDEGNEFDVRVRSGDVVIDAGAWQGDFSAYAGSKGALVYAFEPVSENYEILKKTAELNSGRIIPVKAGLGDSDFDLDISLNTEGNSGGHSIVVKNSETTEKIQITSIDKYVKENGIEKVDFIKADIEGAERDMLKGAKMTLKNFAPRLAICTYHLHDDPEVLKNLIVEANPKYRVVQLRKKLFACV
ncbi:MAG: FkbM family methyltransferase [Spirochaetaceae bacterium]|jgi:FkbM family methyltransferase|nr:FkbM family methyltransferase [Spirochaetaceae bacterium]